jgi:hypothetical protein
MLEGARMGGMKERWWGLKVAIVRGMEVGTHMMGVWGEGGDEIRDFLLMVRGGMKRSDYNYNE